MNASQLWEVAKDTVHLRGLGCLLCAVAAWLLSRRRQDAIAFVGLLGTVAFCVEASVMDVNDHRGMFIAFSWVNVLGNRLLAGASILLIAGAMGRVISNLSCMPKGAERIGSSCLVPFGAGLMISALWSLYTLYSNQRLDTDTVTRSIQVVYAGALLSAVGAVAAIQWLRRNLAKPS